MKTRSGRTSFDPGRRRTLRWTAVAGVAAAAGCGGVLGDPPPKETGLSFEGLLKDQAGFQPRTPAPLPVEAIPGFLSKAQLQRSYAVYRAAFEDLLSAEEALQSVGRERDAAERYAALRKRQLNAANSVLLHELYFRNLATTPVEPTRYVLSMMSEHIGSMQTWREDFAACARVAGAWAVLVYDPYDDRWHNLPLGEDDAGGMAGANPLVVCDVADSAWSLDYEDRETYASGFLDHIDWSAVASRYRAVDRQ